MTAKEFLKHIEGYYGRYQRTEQKATCFMWAQEVEYALEQIWPEILKSFSSQYGKQPDVATFEAIGRGIGGEEWRWYLKPPSDAKQIGFTAHEPTDDEREEVEKQLADLKEKLAPVERSESEEERTVRIEKRKRMLDEQAKTLGARR